MGKTVSASFCKGKGSIAHNNREFITPNVDKERINQNIIYKQEPLEEAYRNLFGEAVQKYNEKQKRADRKISDYMEHIRKSKNGEKLFYENVVQVGTMFSCNVKSEDGAMATKILDEYMKEFQNRNPNLYVFNAVMHLDEQTPHLHVDYIPIATEYKNGLNVRNSLDKALKQQGIDGAGGKRGNSTQNWQQRERDYLATIIERNGWEYAQPKGIDRSNLSLSQYKAMASEIENQVAVLPEQITATPVPLSKDKVIVSKEDLDELVERAKLIQIREDVIGNLEAYREEKEIEIDGYISEIKQQADLEAQKILEAAKKKMADAEKESASVFSLKQNLGRELADARMTKEQYEKLCKDMSGLSVVNDKLKIVVREQEETIGDLRKENLSLKNDISQKIEDAIKPFKDEIEALKSKMKQIALGEATLLKAVKYVAERFSGEVSGAILRATHQTGDKWLKEDGFEEFSGYKSGLPKTITAKMGLELTFKDGEEGKGVYSKNGTCVANFNSLKDAREMFPNCQIEDKNRSKTQTISR